MRKAKRVNVLSEENIKERKFFMDKIIQIFKDFEKSEKTKVKQCEIAEIFDVTQPRVSCLLNKHYLYFSSELLKDYLNKIGYKMVLKNNSDKTMCLITENNTIQTIKRKVSENRLKSQAKIIGEELCCTTDLLELGVPVNFIKLYCEIYKVDVKYKHRYESNLYKIDDCLLSFNEYKRDKAAFRKSFKLEQKKEL